MEDKIVLIENRLEKIEKTMDLVVNILTKLDTTVQSLETKINHIQGNSSHTLETLGTGVSDVLEEIKKIGAVTGYKEQVQNLSKFPN